MYQPVKRIFDFMLSLGALIFLAPLLLSVAAWVKADSPGPILFRQKRIGQHKKFFNILKFRTMRTDTPATVPTHQLANPQAFITRSGAFLRRSSLDELPQLFNILKGDMSLVGPRPALYNQDDLVAERDRWKANEVPMGLTGWAQINGRDKLSIPVKAFLDGEYVRRRNFALDLRILGLTFLNVFRSSGIIEGGTSTIKRGDADNSRKN
ncbi:MAG: sugar transferase [Candidatus Adiutrix intracellularis]|nr:sugar transferase [Candidatus Adiutrix intracellularis]